MCVQTPASPGGSGTDQIVVRARLPHAAPPLRPSLTPPLLPPDADFTFVCPTEITAFSDRHAEFKKINTEILGVSVDSQFSHLAWIQTDRKEGEPWGRTC